MPDFLSHAELLLPDAERLPILRERTAKWKLQQILLGAQQRIEQERPYQKVFPEGVLELLGDEFKTDVQSSYNEIYEVNRRKYVKGESGFGPMPGYSKEALYRGAGITISRAINKPYLIQEQLEAEKLAEAERNRIVADEAVAARRREREEAIRNELGEQLADIIELHPQPVQFDQQDAYASAGM